MTRPLDVASLPLLGLLAAGWAYWLAAWWCVRRHLRGARKVGRGAARAAVAAPVSVLKPLKGDEPDLYDNLASFCRQDLPEFELLFGVRDADDPSTEVVRRLQREWPERRIALVVAPDLGLNPKTAILHELTDCARHELLVISDSDIRVQPGHLREVTAALEDPRIALVTCLYRARGFFSLPATMEALHTDFTFLPSVVVGSCIGGVPIALGASIAMRRSELLAAGGYRAIADELADDYAVAAMLTRSGKRCSISQSVVEHSTASRSWRDLWLRGIRWARTIRSVEPERYLGLPVIFAIPWATLVLATHAEQPWAWGSFGATVMLRIVVAWAIAVEIGDPAARRRLIWLPLRDCLDVPLWCAGVLGARVTWRGTTYRVRRDGQLVPPSSPARGEQVQRPLPGPGTLRRLIARLDRWLRAREHIFEFTADAECVLRARWARAPEEVVLADGTRIGRGARYLELHLWNEHVPKLGRVDGSTLAWAATTQRRLQRSLVLLADFLETQGELRDVRAVHGRAAFLARDPEHVARLLRRLGFELREHGARPSVRSWLHDRGENLLIRGLAWAFNPAPGHRRALKRRRHAVWMSRDALLTRYGAHRESDGAAAPLGAVAGRTIDVA